MPIQDRESAAAADHAEAVIAARSISPEELLTYMAAAVTLAICRPAERRESAVAIAYRAAAMGVSL